MSQLWVSSWGSQLLATVACLGRPAGACEAAGYGAFHPGKGVTRGTRRSPANRSKTFSVPVQPRGSRKAVCFRKRWPETKWLLLPPGQWSGYWSVLVEQTTFLIQQINPARLRLGTGADPSLLLSAVQASPLAVVSDSPAGTFLGLLKSNSFKDKCSSHRQRASPEPARPWMSILTLCLVAQPLSAAPLHTHPAFQLGTPFWQVRPCALTLLCPGVSWVHRLTDPSVKPPVTQSTLLENSCLFFFF